MMLVLQLLEPKTICALPMVTGATPFTPSNSIIALASFTLSVGALPPPVLAPPEVCDPESTMNRLLPMALMDCETAYCAPWPIAIISTTAPTPMTMPSIVRKVRKRLAPMACQASPSMAENIRQVPQQLAFSGQAYSGSQYFCSRSPAQY